MQIVWSVGLGLLGLGFLTLGGDWLVRGATRIARFAGLTPAVIGLTVVAAGTSFPELTVSVMAAMQGSPDLAIGNVVGSNIFNGTAILGLTALLMPLPVRGNVVRLEWPVMMLASVVCWAFLRDALLDRGEGVALLFAMVVFVGYSLRLARKELTAEESREFTDEVVRLEGRCALRGVSIAVAGVLAGVGLLVAGGSLLVQSSIELARLAGLSERVIGLTIVAAGTSAPEVAASLVAAYRKQADVAIANVIGSNIFNLLGILGTAAVIHPIAFNPAMAGSDLWWMLGTALLLFPLMRSGMIISRWEGGVLLGAYAMYLALLLVGER